MIIFILVVALLVILQTYQVIVMLLYFLGEFHLVSHHKVTLH